MVITMTTHLKIFAVFLLFLFSSIGAFSSALSASNEPVFDPLTGYTTVQTLEEAQEETVSASLAAAPNDFFEETPLSASVDENTAEHVQLPTISDALKIEAEVYLEEGAGFLMILIMAHFPCGALIV